MCVSAPPTLSSEALKMQRNYDEAFEWLMKSMALPSPITQEKADEEIVQSYRAAYQTSGWQGVLREDVKRVDAGRNYYFFGGDKRPTRE